VMVAAFDAPATCPPSSSVRQASIAEITLIWDRLTCPALACRHAGPWARKMSAISSFGRDTSAPGHSNVRFTVWSCNLASIS
jgi:hypothetical protein